VAQLKPPRVPKPARTPVKTPSSESWAHKRTSDVAYGTSAHPRTPDEADDDVRRRFVPTNETAIAVERFAQSVARIE
jgi:hypothetical protein